MATTRYRKALAAATITVGIAVLLVRGCVDRRGKDDSEEHAQASRVSVKDGMSIITIDKATMARSGIAATPLLPGTHREARSFYGRVLDPRMFRSLRDDYESARKQAESAHRAVDSSRAAYEGMKTLRAARGQAGDRDLKAAEARLRSDEAFAGAADGRLRAVERAARAQWGEGMAHWMCEDPRRLDRLVDEKEKIVQVTVPSRETTSPSREPARIKTLDGDSIAAEPISTALCAESEGGGMNYFYLAPAESNGVMPGMMLLVDMSIGQEIRGVTIPSSAVVWYEGKTWIYVQTDAERLARREVRAGIPVDGGWFVTDGFSQGELIVTSGAQLLLSDEFLAQYQIIEVAE